MSQRKELIQSFADSGGLLDSIKSSTNLLAEYAQSSNFETAGSAYRTGVIIDTKNLIHFLIDLHLLQDIKKPHRKR